MFPRVEISVYERHMVLQEPRCVEIWPSLNRALAEGEPRLGKIVGSFEKRRELIAQDVRARRFEIVARGGLGHRDDIPPRFDEQRLFDNGRSQHCAWTRAI